MKKKITFVVAFTTLSMVFSGCSTNKEPEATFVNPVYEIDGLTPLRDGIDEPYYYEYYMFDNNDNVYKYADEYHNGMAPISQAGEFDFSGLSWTKYSGKWGFLNTKGELAIPMIYDYVYNFNNLGIACVGKVYHNFDKEYNRNGTMLFGYIDKKGNEIIPIEYDIIGHFITNDTTMAVQLSDVDGGTHGKDKTTITIYNHRGKVIKTIDDVDVYPFVIQLVPRIPYDIFSFHENRAIIYINNVGYCIIDSQGNIIKNLTEEYNMTKENVGGWLPFNADGECIVQMNDDHITSYDGKYDFETNEYIQHTTEDYLCHYIDKQGNIVDGAYIDLSYLYSKEFRERFSYFGPKDEFTFNTPVEDNYYSFIP